MTHESLPQGDSVNNTALDKRIIRLEDSLQKLESRLQEQTHQIEEFQNQIPTTSLLSPSFLRRAFTVWGHYFVAQLLIAVPIYCIFFILALILGVFNSQ